LTYCIIGCKFAVMPILAVEFNKGGFFMTLFLNL
jgi:hypothetical protein